MSSKPMTLKRLQKIVANIEFDPWQFTVEEWQHKTEGSKLILRVGDPNGVDTFTGKPYPWKGRHWIISSHATENEVILTAFKAVITALEHEARESFTYKGVDLLNPHYDMGKLRRLRMAEKGLDVRDNKDYERLPAFITGVPAA